MVEKDESIELQEFINSTLDAIERGTDLKNRSIQGSVEFEVSVKKISKKDGGVKLYIFTGAAKKMMKSWQLLGSVYAPKNIWTKPV